MAAASPILMPKLGLTMTEGLVAEWRVRPGQAVRAGDVLFVVETEKIATEIEAQGEGRIESIAAEAGATVPVGAVVATWTGPPSGALEHEPVGRTAAPPPLAAEPGPRPNGRDRVLATPFARRLARQGGIDLTRLAGSGPRGRIKAADVEAAIARAKAPGARPAPATAPEARPISPAPASSVSGERRPATSFEKVVARRLTQAKQTIPHFYVLTEADVTRLAEMRQELNASGEAVRISLNHMILAAAGRALARMPETNRLWVEDDIVRLSGSDLGVAVDTPRGLVAPVLREAGSLSLDGVAARAAALVERARAGTLAAADFEGGALSVSNVGMFGASHLVPIINPGQSAILGVGAAKPVFRPDRAGAPALRQELGLVLSCDHRVWDGVTAARFLDLVKQLLERPLQLLRG